MEKVGYIIHEMFKVQVQETSSNSFERRGYLRDKSTKQSAQFRDPRNWGRGGWDPFLGIQFNAIGRGRATGKQFAAMERGSMFQENRSRESAINSPSPPSLEPRHERTVSSRPFPRRSFSPLALERNSVGAASKGEKYEANIHQRAFVLLH